jgi:hypothetical protein
MLSSCGKDKPCHIAPEGVRGPAHLHARLSNVIFAAALHQGQERIAYPPGTQPPEPKLPLIKRADAVNFFRSALGGELAWVFRILTFAGESETFSLPVAERVFALEDAAGFEPRAWDGNLVLVGATRSAGELLIGDMPEAVDLFTGNVYSAIAYPARLVACRIVD